MKCPKPDCGTEGVGKYCHKCGTKRVAEIVQSANDVIICSGTGDDGKPCGARLTADQAFCEHCGTNVVEQFKCCEMCGSAFYQGTRVCVKCDSNSKSKEMALVEKTQPTNSCLLITEEEGSKCTDVTPSENIGNHSQYLEHQVHHSLNKETVQEASEHSQQNDELRMVNANMSTREHNSEKTNGENNDISLPEASQITYRNTIWGSSKTNDEGTTSESIDKQNQGLQRQIHPPLHNHNETLQETSEQTLQTDNLRVGNCQTSLEQTFEEIISEDNAKESRLTEPHSQNQNEEQQLEAKQTQETDKLTVGDTSQMVLEQNSENSECKTIAKESELTGPLAHDQKEKQQNTSEQSSKELHIDVNHLSELNVIHKDEVDYSFSQLDNKDHRNILSTIVCQSPCEPTGEYEPSSDQGLKKPNPTSDANDLNGSDLQLTHPQTEQTDELTLATAHQTQLEDNDLANNNKEGGKDVWTEGKNLSVKINEFLDGTQTSNVPQANNDGNKSGQVIETAGAVELKSEGININESDADGESGSDDSEYQNGVDDNGTPVTEMQCGCSSGQPTPGANSQKAKTIKKGKYKAKRERKRLMHNNAKPAPISQEKVFGSGKLDKSGEELSSTGSSLFPTWSAVDKEELMKKDQKEKQNAIIEATGDTNNGKKNKNIRPKEKFNDKSGSQIGGLHINSFENETMQQNTQKSSPAETVLVIFHVLVSHEMLEDPDCKIILRFGAADLGGWDKDSRIMTRTMRFEKYVEYEFEMQVQRYLLEDPNNEYRYSFRKQTQSDEQNIDELVELYGAHKSHNRSLHISQNQIGNSAVWHQYDGFIIPKPDEGRLKKTIGYIRNFLTGDRIKGLKRLAYDFFMAFLPPIFKGPIRGQDFPPISETLLCLRMLIGGIRKVYLSDLKCWKENTDFTEEIIVSQWAKLVELLAENTSCQTSTERVIQAICVVISSNSYDIRLSQPAWQELCKCLLISVDGGSTLVIEWAAIQSHFPNGFRTLRTALIGVIKKHTSFREVKDPSWMFCLPLLHLVSGACTSFEEPSQDISHTNQVPKWWGIDEIDDVVGRFQAEEKNWSMSLKDVLGYLNPLFGMDYYLQRSIVASLNVNELHYLDQDWAPIEVACAALVFWVKTTKDTCGGYDYKVSEKRVDDALECVMKRLQACFKTEVSNRTNNAWWMAHKIAYELVIESFRHHWKRSFKRLRSVHIFLHCTAMYQHCKSNSSNSKPLILKDTEQPTQLQSVKVKCTEWLSTLNEPWQELLAIWNVVFLESLQSEEILKEWNNFVLDNLRKRLSILCTANRHQGRELVGHYCKAVNSYCRPMQDCLNAIVFEIIEKEECHYIPVGEEEKSRFSALMSRLLLSNWERANKEDDRDGILRLALSWPQIKLFIKHKCHGGQVLNNDCQRKIEEVCTLIESIRESILVGSVDVHILMIVQQHTNDFCDIVEIMKNTDHKLNINTLIQLRLKEVETFQKQTDIAKVFVNLCQTFKVDTTELTDILNSEIDEQQIKWLAEPEKAKHCQDVHTFIPDIIPFRSYENVLHTVARFDNCHDSIVFRKFWADMQQQFGTVQLSIDELLEDVWSPVVESWQDFGEQLNNGDIRFQEFEHMLSGSIQAKEELLQQIVMFDISPDVANIRIDQLIQWRQLCACVVGARAILKLQRRCNLKGNFGPILAIAENVSHDFKMNEFDESLMATCELLKDVTAAKSECLDEFSECNSLVKWLQDSMKESGHKELKVFVDLAMMSVGDDPMNICKVQSLHSAVIGYSPLIFDLQPESDYKELLDRCRMVWKELAANKNLPDQLADTNRQLPWLMEIQKAHGSVEITSLLQADSITSGGIFTVGVTGKHNKANKETMNEDIIQLIVPEQKKHYTFKQLQDLHSRLMSVAGKNQQTAKDTGTSVEMYTLMLDSVTRLGNVLRKLCESGCVLFNTWKGQFWCKPNRRIGAEIAFGNEKDLPKIVGRTNETEKVQHMIHEIAKFLENCLDEWLQYIRLKRIENYFLNFFTTDQLVILQRELAKMGCNNLPSRLIYPLLSAVKKDCTAEDLITALGAARMEVDSKTSRQHNVVPTMDNTEETKDNDGEKQKEAFVQDLVTAGFDKTLAILALDQVDEEDILSCDVTRAILWCMQQSGNNTTNDTNEEKMEMENVVQPDMEPLTFTGWNASSSTLESIIENTLKQINQQSSDDGVLPLIEDLKGLWEHFLASVSSSISDFLSLEHLGIVLKHLAVSEAECVERKYASNYQIGEPNLIVCPTGEILKVTLSIYMHDKKQPLPMSDEVLVCRADTAIDEIEIFWRRAVNGNGKRIHCLVNADVLNYDVGEAADRSLQDFILETNHKTDLQYRLFIICGSDNEYRCPLVSSLDKYRRQVQTVDQDAVKIYVEEKLVVPRTRIHSASCVDFNGCSTRIVMSTRAGVGKSLYVQRQAEALKQNYARSKVLKTKVVKIPLQEKNINMHEVIQAFLEHTPTQEKQCARLFHIDISHEVQEGIDLLLFNLLILNWLMDNNGYVWRRSMDDLYLVETLPIMAHNATKRDDYAHQIFGVLPEVTCRSPQESLNVYEDLRRTDQLFDEKQFRSPVFQRTYQYLQRFDSEKTVSDVDANNPEGNPNSCLEVMLRRCGVINPSWSELHNFVWFLNTQLVDYEHNQFVSQAASADLPGFATFVLRFLMQMSKDFATRSLNISEETPSASKMQDDGDMMEDEDFLNRFALRRTWESSPHPYLFFNSDHFTFTFLGFFIEKTTGNLIDQQTSRVLDQAIMAPNLYDALVRNNVPLQENFDYLQRDQKIMKLCNVMGIEVPHDPDSTYELTTDNVKKILAIYMRFRCDIPVVIMGETGCGKTRLVKFMCALQCPPGVKVKNMILMKVHGGTTKEDIKRSIQRAEKQARKNVGIMAEYKTLIYTVLFFDEANTTEAIGIIKEVMCDKSICGEPLKFYQNVKIVAACNPYRKHPDELIHKLEQAGLGYHVDADETTDRLGRVPMRRLVYRVQPLPQSLLPLVWDFGQLNTDVEILYIRQMVKRYVDDDKLPDSGGLIDVMSRILTVSQQYMRDQKDECSFVSLRDVQRVLTVMAWFYDQAEKGVLYKMMNEKLSQDQTSDAQDSHQEEYNEIHQNRGLDNLTRSLVLALGVCYHACLRSGRRPGYRERVSKCFREPCLLPGGDNQIAEEIECCQDVFLENVLLDDNIARNTALKENVFMMVVCIELRIPLFLVGKPGSSKSLAKTIVADAMQGNCAKFPLFKNLKQVQMVSFQCSPLATPDGIVGTFRQCAQFQQHKDLDTFVSVVVLDEVGLAEDSPRMPLKTLHPLLEDGCQGDEKPEPHKKVAFIGISNWALDPAKMNRGIFVQREVPDVEELKNSARGICHQNAVIQPLLEPLIEPLSNAYLDVFQYASAQMREFYGLRDFYSLVKMLYDFVDKSKQSPTWFEMLHAIKRNFGGLAMVNPEKHFERRLRHLMACGGNRRLRDPDCSAKGLIEACLFESVQLKGECRYLLLLTENYGALSIIQQQIFSKRCEIRPITIFGSSFRSDQEYTQVCRNINKIKVCMETGNTVVLLNLENLYESLYDALNQYYVYFGGVRYVDLGLGTHRVKCPVHHEFRLIVVAEKQTVYKKFPIPLINRLEKHFLTMNSILDQKQIKLATELQGWANKFAAEYNDHIRGATLRQVGDVFIGFHEDTCSAIILHVFEKHKSSNITDQDVLEEGKQLLLWCATPESLVCNSQLDKSERDRMTKYYYQRQAHDSFIQYLKHKLEKEKCMQLFAQITCHSKLLAGNHAKEILKEIPSLHRVEMLSLSSFDTEQQFSNRVQHILTSKAKEATLIIIQCDSGDVNSKLIACARYCVMDEVVKNRDNQSLSFFVVFIVQLPRKAGGCFSDFQCGDWHSAHIDDLYPEDDIMPHMIILQNKTVSEIFSGALPPLLARCAKTETEKAKDCLPNAHNKPHQPIDRGTETESMESDNYSRDRGIAPEIGDITLEMTGPNDTSGNSKQQRVNMCGLLRHCVQPALSIVKDNPNAEQRETKRVDIVLRSWSQCVRETDTTDKDLFTLGILAWIVKLFKEKERETGFLSEQWLIRHAAAMENINKNGTLRRSCFNTIISKVAPVLAGVFAFLDTNSNMDLVDCDVPWKRDFWLKCLNRKDVLPLKYGDGQSPTGSGALKELLVTGTGFEGHEFKLRMPFSWVVIQMVDELFRDLVMETVAVVERIAKCVTALKASPFGKLFFELSSNIHVYKLTQDGGGEHPDLLDLLQDYIHDFVQTIYNTGSDAELNVVCEQVMSKSTRVCSEIGGTNDLICHIVCCRFAYEELACKLTFFRNINNVWPSCSSKIAEIQQSKPDHFMFKEHEFTFSALCMLLEELTPKTKELDESASRKNWLSRVYRYRPVVETMLNIKQNDLRFGVHSENAISKAKSMWSRVLVMKLFIENVCTNDSEKNIAIRHCMALWMLLVDDVDLGGMKSFAAVEAFLKLCNQTALRETIGSQVKCCKCEDSMQSAPVTLPCKKNDIICQPCFTELRALKDYRCPTCKEAFPKEWEPTIGEDSKLVNKLQQYQKRCNAFFLEVVSQLCFANGDVSEQVISKLLGYVTCKSKTGKMFTKNINIIDTGLDPNPVFRSFLLQLILKSRKERYVSSYLRQFIEHTELDSDTNPKDRIDIYLLIVQCWEDTQLQCIEQSAESRAASVCELFGNALVNINNHQSMTELLYGIATTKACLAATARCLAEFVEGANRTIPGDIRKIIQAAKEFCDSPNTETPKVYLVKVLCRRYGIDIYHKLSKSRVPIFNWIAIEGTAEQVEVSDRYIVLGETYTRVREAIAKTLLGEDVGILNDLLQEIHTRGERLEIVVQLAVHREVTCANVRRSFIKPKKGIKRLAKLLSNSVIVEDKEFVQRLLNNDLHPRFLAMRPETDMLQQGAQCLLTHFKVIMSKLHEGSILLYPLMALINGNPNIQNMFLPTMPQDDLEDIHNAVLRNRGNENPVVYRCPRGHPYLIGDCGRPNATGFCPECQQQIGGTGHQALPGNIVNNIGDTTKRGHILGRASKGDVAHPERDLNPAYCTAVRLLLHMAMYLGPVEQIQPIIQPVCPANQVSEFLLDHIIANISSLQRALGRSADDVILLMHAAVHNMMLQSEKTLPQGITLLSSKADRRAWENEFSATVLREILGNVDHWLTSFNNRIATDQRLGADPLMCLIYETDNNQEREDPNNLLNVPRMWRFRIPITVDHMRQELDSKIQGLKPPPRILQRFLVEDYILQALRYLPNIMLLLRALLQKFQKKLDRAEASMLKVKDLKKELLAGHETERWLDDFSKAWEITRMSLSQGCPTKFGRVTVPEEFSNARITDNTPLAVLLPAANGPGLCSYAMLDLLFRKQNELLDFYVHETGRQDAPSSVIPMAVTSAHLISYDHEHDLMPLVLANCHFSFEMGVGTKIEYDFAGMERQLMDRLLYSKSRIEIHQYLEIDLMVYRTEVTNVSVFKKLQDNIPQEQMNAAVRNQICEELRVLPDVCASLDNLDIAISFLKTTGGDPAMPLYKFMVETLRMDKALLSQKARQSCDLRHARSLWLLLSFHKSRLLVDYRHATEAVLETLPNNFYQDLPEGVKSSFEEYMKQLSIDKLSNLVELLHEFLLLKVAVHENPDDDDFVDTKNYSLFESLRQYIELSDTPMLDPVILNGSPEGLLYEHSAKAWVLAYETVLRKIGSRRRN